MQDYIAVKPGIFLLDEMDLGISTIFDNDKPKDLLHKVSIAIMYYRALYKKEILLAQIKDVIIDTIINTEFLCSTKRRCKGFRLKIPEKLISIFKICIS